MTTIIAEKPSVAAGIAAVVGARKREDGFISGNGYNVTWAFGHLIELASPDAYGYGEKWEKDKLPILPDKFKTRTIESKDKKSDSLYKKQLKTITSLFKKSDTIIVATDAGREGELIFRYIFEYVQEQMNIQATVKRLWISSLTDKSIREGMKNLRPISEYDNLFAAGKARSEADWLIGMNGTRATTINVNDGTVWSVGRVQTPTLSMICRRFIENRNFIPEPFHILKLTSSKTGIQFCAFNHTKFNNKEDALEILRTIGKAAYIKVSKVEKKPGYSMPPLLYDLTSLQKEANSKYGFSAEITLKLCQSLYEKKLVTYPRTGSRYIPDDIYDTLPELIKNAELYPKFSEYAKSVSRKPLGRISVNASKVTDHHALLPTENIPKDGEMTDGEMKIYEMILGRMLETVSPKEEKDITTVHIIADGMDDFPFIAKGSVIKVPGWKTVFNEKSNVPENENSQLPPLKTDEVIPLEKLEVLDKKTKAPALLTESSLLALMETAGKELENEEEREALKNIGIGTPATRAETIEKLIRTKYIVREKKTLIPTEKGLSLYDKVKDMQIANVELTGKWENALDKIEAGKLNAAIFNAEIRNYTRKCTDELLNINIDSTMGPRERKKELLLECPKCGGKFIVYDKVCRCSDKDNCGFFFWRVICQRRLTEKDIQEILTDGKTKGKVKLKKKDGTKFEAQLILEDDGKFTFKWE